MVEQIAHIESGVNFSHIFSGEQKKALKDHGYSVFCLDRLTIKSLERSDTSFISTWHKGLTLEDEPSMGSEVAIKTDSPFLLGSGSKTVHEQLLMAEGLSEEISKKISGVKVVMGSAFDYLALGEGYKKQTGRSLFRSGVCYDHAASTTFWSGHSLFVGEFYEGSAIVSYRFGESGYSDIKLMPLIVPDSQI